MRYDELANRIAAEYVLFLFALSGRYHQMRAPGIEVTPRAIVDLETDTRMLARTFYSTANVEIERYLSQMRLDASDSLLGGIAHRELELQGLIRGILATNLAQITMLARTGLGSFAGLLLGSKGAIGLLAQRQAGVIEYQARDYAGRKWDAKKLMRFIVRDFAYQAEVDSRVEKFAENGVDLLLLSDGQVVSIGGTEGHTWIADIWRQVFHPNGNITMEAYVPT